MPTHQPSPEEVTGASLEIAEFVYQAIALGVDRHILRRMDITDASFYMTLETAGFLDIHDDLKRIAEEEYSSFGGQH